MLRRTRLRRTRLRQPCYDGKGHGRGLSCYDNTAEDCRATMDSGATLGPKTQKDESFGVDAFIEHADAAVAEDRHA